MSACSPLTSVHLAGNIKLCVLEAIRQIMRSTQKPGVQKARIVEYLQQQAFVNGDIDAQVTTALKTLLCGGVVERIAYYGYRVAGRPVGSATLPVPLGPNSSNTPIVFACGSNDDRDVCDGDDDQSLDA